MHRRDFLTLTALAATAPLFAEEPKVRVAVIGHTGKGDYGHGLDTMWLGVPETEIVGFSDADEKGRAKEEAKLKGVKAFADYQELLAATKPDIAAVCPRQMSEHYAMCLAAIEAGVKGIYIEKPFARSLAECDEIIAAAKRKNVKIAIAHRNRYNPAHAAIDKIIQDGTIGNILEIRARGKEDTRGGAQDLWVLGSHVLNVCCYYGGRPLACTAMLYQDARPATKTDVVEGSEDVGPVAGNAVHARFEMERGFPVYFDSVQNAGDRTAGFGLDIVGSKGTINFRMDTVPIAHLVPGNPFKPDLKQPRPWIPITTAGAGQPEPIADLQKKVMGHLEGARDLLAAIKENRQPICGPEDGRLGIEMTFAIFASHIQNGARVVFPIQESENPLAKWK